MDLQDAQHWLTDLLNEVSIQFQKVPGSAILLRYIKSSYQNDPVRSAVELFLFLFAVRYLLAPTYSTKEKRKVKLTDEVCPYQGWFLAKGLSYEMLMTFDRRSMNWSRSGPLNLLSRRRRPLRRPRMRRDLS